MRKMLDGYPYSAGAAQFAPLASDTIDARVLTANSAESHSIPAEATYVVFSATGDFYAKFGGSASVPAGDVTDGNASELNPGARRIPSGATSIGLVAPSDCVVTLAFYA